MMSQQESDTRIYSAEQTPKVLKSQFQQQREKIEELKSLLKTNEKKLINKEKEVEKYATKLSDIKVRARASKTKATVLQQESDVQQEKKMKCEKLNAVASPDVTSGRKLQGNLVLLRKNLEENRLKFELRGKEISENKKGIEQMVHHLKTQLDERDVKIRELQKILDVQESDNPEKLQSDSELTSGENFSDAHQDIYALIEHKDNKITELNRTILDLEVKILDLQENFNEKDSIIAARTKAVELMSEDFSRRSRTTLDHLEETQEEMRKMQNNFVLQELKLKNQIEQLKQELENRDLRLQQVEDSNRQLEACRNEEIMELKNKIAELEEENGNLRLHSVDLEKIQGDQEEKIRMETEIEALKSSLLEFKEQNLSMEVRNLDLEKQLESLKEKRENINIENSEISVLNNSLLEIKAELVNAHKVIGDQKATIINLSDGFENWKEACNKAKKQLLNKEEQIEKLEAHCNEMLTENSVLQQRLQEQKNICANLTVKMEHQSNLISDQDKKINSLQSSIELSDQTSQAKEMAFKDIQDKLTKAEMNFQSKFYELKSIVSNKEKESLELNSLLNKQNEVLKNKDVEIQELTDALDKQKHEYLILRDHMSSSENDAHLLELKLIEKCKTVDEKDQLNSQLMKDCQSYRHKIELINSEISDKTECIKKFELEITKIKELESKLEEAKCEVKARDEELFVLKTELMSARDDVQRYSNDLKEAENKLTRILEKNKKLIGNLKTKSINIKALEQKLEQYEITFEAKEKMIAELTLSNNTLSEDYLREKNLLCEELEGQKARSEKLSRELLEEHKKMQQMGEELRKARDNIIVLENDLAVAQTKIGAMNLIDEQYSISLNKIAVLELEISELQMKLRSRDEEINMFVGEKIEVSTVEKELGLKQETEKEMQGNLKSLAENLQCVLPEHTFSKKDIIEKINIMVDTLFKDVPTSEKLAQLTNDMIEKNLTIDNFIAQLLTSIVERNKLALLTNETKFQEREAVIESLEQECSKAEERIHKLEEELTTVEQRHLLQLNEQEALHLKLQEKEEQILNLEMKLSEFQHEMNLKVQKAEEEVKCLESDWKKINVQLEEVMLEKEVLLKKCEQLHLEKINSEHEIERLSELVATYTTESFEMKEKINVEYNYGIELQDKIKLLETELQNKMFILEEKDKLINEIEEKVKKESSKVRSILAENNKSNERIKQLEKELESEIAISLDKNKRCIDMQNQIASLESEMKKYQDLIETENVLSLKKSDINLKHTLCQEITFSSTKLENSETVSTQNDKLPNLQQLQFERASDITNISLLDKIKYLEKYRTKLLEVINSLEVQVSDLYSNLNSSNSESRENFIKIDELEEVVERLQKLIIDKNIQQEIQPLQNTSETPCPLELRNSNQNNESQDLQQQQQQNYYKELVHLKAQEEISEIIKLAENQVLHMSLGSNSSVLNDVNKKLKFQNVPLENNFTPQISGSCVDDKITKLEEELTFLRNERDYILSEIDQISTKFVYILEKSFQTEIDDKVLTSEDNTKTNVQNIGNNDYTIIDSEISNIISINASFGLNEKPTLALYQTGTDLTSKFGDINNDNRDCQSNDILLEGDESIKKTHCKSSLFVPSTILNKHITILEKFVKNAETEKKKLSEALHVSQVRSGKMLKKLKEFKSRDDCFPKESMELEKIRNLTTFTGLEETVEEELRTQLEILEKQLNEIRCGRDLACTWKEKLSKHVELLITVNEHMTKMKEKQCVDLKICKQQNEELISQIQSLELNLKQLESNKKMNLTAQDADNDLESKCYSLENSLQGYFLPDLGKTNESEQLHYKYIKDKKTEEQHKNFTKNQDQCVNSTLELSTQMKTDVKKYEIEGVDLFKYTEDTQDKQELIKRKEYFEKNVEDEIRIQPYDVSTGERVGHVIEDNLNNEDTKQRLAEALCVLDDRANEMKLLNMKLVEKDKCLNVQLSDYECKLNEILHQNHQNLENLKAALSEKDSIIDNLNFTIDERKRHIRELERLLKECEFQLKQCNTQTDNENKQNIESLLSELKIASYSTPHSLDVKKSSHQMIQEGEQNNNSDHQQELDLALYMLHQRDVRCDELTLELMQLLEERDALQLRLSSALRMNEELRNAFGTSAIFSSESAEKSKTKDESFPDPLRKQSPEQLSVPVSTLISVDEAQDLESLGNKLSQLRNLKYHRDVTVQGESQHRHHSQVQLFHQTGRSSVVGASYTLSRDVQSPSVVLLNWIRGRSTPRVMHV